MATERVSPETEIDETTEGAAAPPWMTILHNCECHTFEQVVRQLQKAIACSEAEGWEIAWQVHNTGKAVVKVGAGGGVCPRGQHPRLHRPHRHRRPVLGRRARLPYITGPMIQGANSSSPTPESSLLLRLPEATAMISSKI